MAEAIVRMTNDVLKKLSLASDQPKEPLKEPSSQELESLRGKYERAKQDHCFTFYNELDTAGKASLFEQLQTFDPEHVNELAEKALHPPQKAEDEKEPSMDPLPESATASLLDSRPESIDQWYKEGLEHIANNKVAVVLMAGGQGTRLGSSAPKGCFDIGLPSQKSLFQMQAERIWKVQQLAQKQYDRERVVVPWYVMTSGPTRAATSNFFEEHDYFGLEKENVVIFEQGVLPCISNEGKILLESKSKVIPQFYG